MKLCKMVFLKNIFLGTFILSMPLTIFGCWHELTEKDFSISNDDMPEYTLRFGCNMWAPTSSPYHDSHYDSQNEPLPQLHQLVQKGNIEDLISLLEKGTIDVNEKDSKGLTALHRAVDRLDEQSIRLLYKHGANIDAASSGGYTPLLRALTSRDRMIESRKSMIEILLILGASVNYAELKGNTALHECISEIATSKYYRLPYMIPIISVLLAHGADIHQRNKEGKSPLDLATFFGFGEDIMRICSNSKE